GAIFTWQDLRSGTSYSLYAVEVNAGGQTVGVEPLAADFAPPLAWPNPFRDQVSITFSLTARAPVRIEVFDIAGRRIWMSPVDILRSGRPTRVWSGRTEGGASAMGGMYFLRVRGPGVSASRTVVRVR